MRCFTRSELIRTSALFAALPSMRPRPAVAVFYQAEDKSWDVTFPDTWTVEGVQPRNDPMHFMHVAATRPDFSAAKVDIFVDKVKFKSLKDLGQLNTVANQFQLKQPQPATLVDAVNVPRPGPFSTSSYKFRYTTNNGATLTAVKVAVKQERLYQLVASLPAQAPTSLQEEVQSIVDSFKAFPLNAGCLAQSNRGGVILPGVCY